MSEVYGFWLWKFGPKKSKAAGIAYKILMGSASSGLTKLRWKRRTSK